MRYIAASLMIAVGVAIPASPGEACSCAVREGLCDSQHPIVFVARIVSTQVTGGKALGDEPVVTARYEVIERLRGDPSSIKVLRTVSRTVYGTCGIALTSGDEFIIHTDARGWALECSGTMAYHRSRDKTLIEQLRQACGKK